MNLALFDFDGTITRKDTWYDFMDYVSKKNRLVGLKMFLFLPVFLLYGIRIIPAGRFSEMFLSFCFKGWSKAHFDELGRNYADKKLRELIRQNAWEQIEDHKAKGDRIVVVTASLDSWIKDWCRENDIELISSNLEIIDDVITGKFAKGYCNGIEKVKRIQERFSLEDFETVYAYGDSSGDKEMLELADIAYYRWKKI